MGDTQKIIITGGIATGKSTAFQLLQRSLVDCASFDCDVFVHHLLENDLSLIEELSLHFETDLKDPSNNGINRNALRAIAFSDPAKRTELEAIIHPRVRSACLAQQKLAQASNKRYFLIDIPLFFEKGFDFQQTKVIVVAVSRRTQIERIRNRNAWDDAMISAVLEAQLPIEEKSARADIVFWNEGPLAILEAQVKHFIDTLSMPIDSNRVPAAPTDISSDPSHAEVAPVLEICVNELRQKSLSELQTLAQEFGNRIPAGLSKSDLVYELLCAYAYRGAKLTCSGIVENEKGNFFLLRDPVRSFRSGQDDIHISLNQGKQYQLDTGHLIKISVRAPRERGKYLTCAEIIEIEGRPAAEYQQCKNFEHLTPMFPNQRVMMDDSGPDCYGVRMLDIVAPLGLGQRGLIVAPPRGGKTILLKQIARAIRHNHPDIELIILLLDERPEEVTDFEENCEAQVFSSTFDESPRRHAHVADLVLERAKRLVEQGKHVILLLDSLTRLARGHNAANQGGPIGSGGVNPVALQKSRRFFGAARNVEEGGSLTILATALIETESRMDDVIFEEFKGTGNMEVRLDRELAERRIFPAIHIPQSGTRNDDRLYHPDEFAKIIDIRRQLAQLPVGEAVEVLLKNLQATGSNAEFLLRGLR